jgi:dTDP-4-dehydrorhamnose reductase
MENKLKILIFGNKGQLGVDLMKCSRQKNIHVVGLDLPQCDITSASNVSRAFDDMGPVDMVFNAAAYTAVDQAESRPDAAFAVNRDGAGHLASACRQRGIPLIHISTDYVFDGFRMQPYTPKNATDPQGVYAKSKAAGEAMVRNRLDRHVIIRTSWLFGRYGANFVKTMLRLGKERELVKVVDDQIGSPTYAGDLAEALFRVAEKISEGFSSWGTYHYCNQGALTWYAFARRIFALARAHENLAVRDVIPILSAHYPTPAPRPRYSVLDCSSFDETFGITRRTWEAALKQMLADHYARRVPIN